MPLFKKKQKRSANSPLGVRILGGSSELPAGYHRLLDSP